MALDEARAGAPEGLVVVADFQRHGRGRRGRTWEAEPGSSLLVSVLLRPGLVSARLHLAVAVVALAAGDACSEVAGFRPALKWPNDLVAEDAEDAEDAKVAGVLAEVDGDAVVAGLGLNVAASHRWPPGAAAVEQLAGRPVDRDALLAAFLHSLDARYGDWPGVASSYRQACDTLGRTVQVDLGDEVFVGTAADVSDEGHLLVDVGACLRTVAAGDVVHLRPL